MRMKSRTYWVIGLLMVLALNGVCATRVVYDEPGDCWRVLDGDKLRIRVAVEPYRKGLSRDVRVVAFDDRVEVDMSAAFGHGATLGRIYTANYDIQSIRGKETLFEGEWSFPRKSKGRFVIEGTDANRKHWWRVLGDRFAKMRFHFRRTYDLPSDLTSIHQRCDVSKQGQGNIVFYSHRAVPFAGHERLLSPPKHGEPKLLFHATLDDTAKARYAVGDDIPSVAEGLEFAPGRKGRSLRFSNENGARLAYSLPGNLNPDRGTVAFWIRREWKNPRHPTDPKNLRRDPHSVFVVPAGRNAPGSGAMDISWDDNYLEFRRGDVDETVMRCHKVPYSGEWQYWVVVWDECRTLVFCNGEKMPYGGIKDDWSPIKSALAVADQLFFCRDTEAFSSVFFGNSVKGDAPLNGCIDDIRIWSEPMDCSCVKAMFERENGGALPDYNGWDNPFDPLANTMPERNPYVLAPLSRAGAFGRLELVDQVQFDGLKRFEDGHKFRSVGELKQGELNGVPYVEAVSNGHGIEPRMAVRLKLDANVPMHVIEVDYPDDRERTMDIVAEWARRPPGIYLFPHVLDVGLMGGAEYPLSRRIVTGRYLYWTQGADVSLVVRGIHGSSAAVSGVRAYRVIENALPAATDRARVDPVDRRHFALFFEDPALENEFVVNLAAPGALQEHLNRLTAYMKFAGQNMLCYPGVWYHGLISNRYMPRKHADHFLREFCRRFDREGLSIMPTMNLQTVPDAKGVITAESVRDGTLHDSIVSIHATGRPNPGGWHGTPPIFNIAHPDVQSHIRHLLRQLLDECAEYSSFKGVCLHLVRITCLWWGDIENGYNDYCIDAFEKATGVHVPVDRADPLRGKAYAAWLKTNAYEAWVDWRCDVLTDFYSQLNADLKSYRKDLRLWLMAQPDLRDIARGSKEWWRADVVTRLMREAGLNTEKLNRAIPDIIFGNMERYGYWRDEVCNCPGSKDAKARVRDMLYDVNYYAEMFRANHPAVTLWDSYFESAIGQSRGLNQLSGDWLEEIGWRVSVVNPVGRNALRDFALALRFGDVLDFAKGGYLIGTYGTEDVLAPWMCAFCTLPAVKFDDLPSPAPGVVFRGKVHRGVAYRYLCNTNPEQCTFMFDLPGVGLKKMTLDAYDLKVFAVECKGVSE